MIEDEGVLLKLPDPWRTCTGVDEHFLPMSGSISPGSTLLFPGIVESG